MACSGQHRPHEGAGHVSHATTVSPTSASRCSPRQARRRFPASSSAALGSFISISLSVRADGYPAAATCPCITSFSTAWSDVYIVDQGGVDKQLFPASVQNSAGAVDVYYDEDYGLNDCQTWDAGLAPYCDGAQPQSWCQNSWCYVDVNNCIDGEPTISVRDVGAGTPYYSYTTCGVDSMNYAKFERTRTLNATDIRAEIVSYLRNIRDYVENQMTLLGAEEGGHSGCTFEDGCSCSGCIQGAGQWTKDLGGGVTEPGYSIDFDRMTLTHRGGLSQTNTEAEQDAECLARYAEAEFKTIARQEYNDPERLGFLYYGHQAEGVYFGWPGSTLCNDYDPRFRPWYVSAVSGPKSVVLIIDRSGSMNENMRWTMAKSAIEAVVETLTEYDYFGIVLFSSSTEKFEDTMVPATAQNINDMLAWINSQYTGGATLFDQAFSAGFQVIDATHADAGYTHCNGLVLFLTDGDDTSSMDVERVRQLNNYDYAVFTFTFGSGAKDEKPRSIACDNRGIYTHVPDGGEISNAMAGYYEYFASDPAFSNSGTVRWTEYDEITTNREVITGCLPAYDRNVAVEDLAELHGVVCFDIGLMLTSTEFKLKPDYAEVWAEMESSSSQCTVVNPDPEHIDILRARVSDFSSCNYRETASSATGLRTCSLLGVPLWQALASMLLALALSSPH